MVVAELSRVMPSTTDPLRSSRRGDERGSVVPTMVVALFVAASVLSVIGRMGSVVIDSARADAYADSAALAAASGGDEAGLSVATANGAEVVDITHNDDGVVRVTVEHRGHRSVAAAGLGEQP